MSNERSKQASELLSVRYWTSPEELTEAPPATGSEFPAGASEEPDELSRRGMLSLMGASIALASLEGCRRPAETIVPFVQAPEDRLPGVPEHYATAMPFGTAAYGLLVESHDGRPTKVEGNELHPASRGAASAWMQASILGLYDPDRLSSVLAVDPETGSPSPSSWADFAASWQARRTAHLEGAGAGLAILSQGHSSPSLARLTAKLMALFPQARWIAHEPAGDENIFAGIRLATGTASRPVYDLERARVLVTLDADPLHTETDSVALARGFAARRTPDQTMNRLYAVESTLSLTGAAADRRLRIRSSEIPSFLARLVRELASRGVPLSPPNGDPAPPDPSYAAFISDVARDLAAAGAEGLVISGRGQDPAVHAITHAVNAALQSPATLHPLTDVAFADPQGLTDLASEIRRGGISSLVILGGDPAYNAPADIALAEAIRSVEYSVHLTDRENATSSLCTWRLPRAHNLECWGDARSVDGTACIIQPLIEPLLGGRSDLEVVSLLAQGEDASGHELVRETWRLQQDPDLGFERQWRRWLHDGIVTGSAREEGSAAISEDGIRKAWARLSSSPVAGELEITFRPSAATFDGRFANNAWLQEIPDPITKITWSNAALLSPSTADDLGISTGDVIRITLDDRQIEAAAFILPGQADRSLALTLGYGHSDSGRVANGIGYNAYALRSSAAPWTAIDGGVELVGRREKLVQTQEHWRMEGRHLVREATLDEFRANPGFAATPEEHLDPVQLWPQPAYDEGYQWGMAIDLNRCIGCNACVVACQSENNIPVVGADQVARGREMQWLRVDRYFEGEIEDPRVVFQPVACQHCENAPCEQVCPVAATVHDAEGLNVMVYNRCIGTRYCSNNCPYKVRRFNFYNFTKDTPELVKLAMNPDVTVRSRGVMEKCTFCLQRINAAKGTAKKEGRRVTDELQTACQQTCPTDAIVFGDINSSDSRVARVKRNERNYLLLAELGNKPRTSYLAKIRNTEREKKT